MPTTGCADTFTKLVAARDRLRNLTAQLEEAHTHPSTNPQEAAQYAAIRAEWEAALREFKAATKKFSVTVRKLDYDGQLVDSPGRE